MKTETKIKIVVVLTIILSFFAGMALGFGWSYLWYVLAICLIVGCLMYHSHLMEQTDTMTFD
ncbi:MAG: hypothetical protein RBR62_03260 [Bacteroidales bacterium]|jgi:4-hydroxybenzoate polyprenyltransferase|nr:hypothetical protein [Bacteroidales bacterium]